MMLDHEAMSTHTVTVTATDEEGATDTVNVTINVNDAHPGCTYVVPDTRELILGLTNDCEALLDAKEDLGGDLNWSGDTHIGEWDGVTVSVDVGLASSRVGRIWLRGAGLDGSVSAALGRLEMLTVLNLSKNMLSGEIPDLSGTMLQELYLNDNLRWNRNEDGERVSMVEGTGLSGDVPAWLNTMTDMTELWLWGNMLSGALPDLSGMTSLDRLKLNGNTALTGIDAAMLPSGLRWLVAGETDVGATAPDLSDMMSLTTLWLNDTGLEGAIPIASIPTSVTSLNLKDNSLSGTIPDMSGLDNLRYLYLHRNDLSGDIPGTMGDMDSLERLWLHENEPDGHLGGPSPTRTDTLTHLYLDGNNFAEAPACRATWRRGEQRLRGRRPGSLRGRLLDNRTNTDRGGRTKHGRRGQVPSYRRKPVWGRGEGDSPPLPRRERTEVRVTPLLSIDQNKSAAGPKTRRRSLSSSPRTQGTHPPPSLDPSVIPASRNPEGFGVRVTIPSLSLPSVPPRRREPIALPLPSVPAEVPPGAAPEPSNPAYVGRGDSLRYG